VIKTKKNNKKKAKKAAPYLRRTLNDERVHDHLANAAAALHKAYDRASRRGGAEALEDKKLYDHVRGAAGSLRAAFGLVREPEPKPKRRGRKLLVLVAVLGAGGFVAKKKLFSGGDEGRDYSDRPAEPVEPAAHTSQAA
jgi:hypothetical protein